MSSMIEILNKISGLRVSPVSDGTDVQNRILCNELPFVVHEFKSGDEYNGWVVPRKWEVHTAEIKKDGSVIYDGMQHPLAVIESSESFRGTVSLLELKEHLYYFEKSPDDIVYHCDLYYKSHRKLWGFSVPFNVYQSLEEGTYEVNLETKHSPGTMKVLEYTHKGELPDTVVFNAHNCHAAQINDGPAGYVSFIELMKRLRGRKTRYSYRLVIAPEHLGTVFYLANMPKGEIKKMKAGIFCEMVGHDNPCFALQESFTGRSIIDVVAQHVLKFNAADYWSGNYRNVVGNDESVWEAPGYEVPMISLSRCASEDFYYPQYHLSSDTVSIIREEKLEETVSILTNIVEIIEKNCTLKRKFNGIIALSNPKYDLYIAPGTDPSARNHINQKSRVKWSRLMDRILRYFDEQTSILDIAVRHDLPFDEVYDYLVRFKDKGLVDFVFSKNAFK